MLQGVKRYHEVEGGRGESGRRRRVDDVLLVLFVGQLLDSGLIRGRADAIGVHVCARGRMNSKTARSGALTVREEALWSRTLRTERAFVLRASERFFRGASVSS